jgi:hypothetical protein
VVNVDGAAPVYFTVGGAANPSADPILEGRGTLIVLADVGSSTELDGASFQNGATTVKLISAGTPQVGVGGW